MSFSDFSFGSGCSTPILIVSGLWRYFLYAKFFFSTFFFGGGSYFVFSQTFAFCLWDYGFDVPPFQNNIAASLNVL